MTALGAWAVKHDGAAHYFTRLANVAVFASLCHRSTSSADMLRAAEATPRCKTCVRLLEKITSAGAPTAAFVPAADPSAKQAGAALPRGRHAAARAAVR